MSHRFRIPREALRSQPPAAGDASEASGNGSADLPRTYSEPPAPADETAQVSIPDHLKDLAIRTPPAPLRSDDIAAAMEHAIATGESATPASTPAASGAGTAAIPPPALAAAGADTSASLVEELPGNPALPVVAATATTTTKRKPAMVAPPRRKSRAREITNAVLLFSTLLIVSAGITRVIIGLLFAE